MSACQRIRVKGRGLTGSTSTLNDNIDRQHQPLHRSSLGSSFTQRSNLPTTENYFRYTTVKAVRRRLLTRSTSVPDIGVVSDEYDDVSCEWSSRDSSSGHSVGSTDRLRQAKSTRPLDEVTARELNGPWWPSPIIGRRRTDVSGEVDNGHYDRGSTKLVDDVDYRCGEPSAALPPRQRHRHDVIAKVPNRKQMQSDAFVEKSSSEQLLRENYRQITQSLRRLFESDINNVTRAYGLRTTSSSKFGTVSPISQETGGLSKAEPLLDRCSLASGERNAMKSRHSTVSSSKCFRSARIGGYGEPAERDKDDEGVPSGYSQNYIGAERSCFDDERQHGTWLNENKAKNERSTDDSM
jgi:hypothetical protein